MDLSRNILCGWLRLLGWEIETSRDLDAFVAVARRFYDRNVQIAVATAARECDLPMAIFEAVFARVEADRDVQALQLVAA
jgi:hypothetical protein